MTALKAFPGKASLIWQLPFGWREHGTAKAQPQSELRDRKRRTKRIQQASYTVNARKSGYISTEPAVSAVRLAAHQFA